MEKTIKLINSKSGWLARFINDVEVVEAFGTDTIPTPYTENASPMFVLAEIKKRNPEHTVIFA